MTIAEVIAQLPDEVELTTGVGKVNVGDLKEALSRDSSPLYLTTEQASNRYGFSPAYWRDLASDIEGAVKGRSWKIPAVECERHMKERARKTNDTTRKPRGGRPRTAHRAN